MPTLYVDEGKRHGYVLVAATIPNRDAPALRKAVAALKAPGSERVHFVRESDGRKRTILRALTELNLGTTVVHTDAPSDRAARAWCLGQVVQLAAHSGADRIVLETDESVLQFDNQTLYRLTRAIRSEREIRYQHQRAASEPLLWVADAVAWCFGRGGQWSTLVTPLITEIIRHTD